MLKGQAKTDFEKLYNERPPHTPIQTTYSVFMGKSLSEKYGVLVDWFDSVGIQIEIIISNSNYAFQIFKVNNNKPMYSIGEWEVRHQARQKAIEQANEIYNKR